MSLAALPPEQLAAVQRAFGMRYAVGHAVDMRRSVALPWGRYYFVIMAGRDRARAGSGRLAPLMLAATVALFAALVIGCGFLTS